MPAPPPELDVGNLLRAVQEMEDSIATLHREAEARGEAQTRELLVGFTLGALVAGVCRTTANPQDARSLLRDLGTMILSHGPEKVTEYFGHTSLEWPTSMKEKP